MDAIPTTAGVNQTPLGDETIRFLEKISKVVTKPMYEMTPVEARALFEELTQVCEGGFDFKGEKKDWKVPSKQVKDGVPIRVYTPIQLPSDPVIFLYIHGGGHTIGSIKAYEPCCMHLAELCGAIVVSLDYRLGPEHRMPAGLEDVECVAQWVMANKARIGGSDGSAVGVGGDSAGGWLTAQVCQYVTGFTFQVLIYPCVNAKVIFESAKEYKDAPFVDAKTLEWYYSHFLPDVPDLLTNPRYNPYQQPRFDHLPPALFIVAECDALVDDSYEYAKKLSDAGIENKIVLLKGTCHGQFHFSETCKEFTTKAYGAIAEFISTTENKA